MARRKKQQPKVEGRRVIKQKNDEIKHHNETMMLCVTFRFLHVKKPQQVVSQKKSEQNVKSNDFNLLNFCIICVFHDFFLLIRSKNISLI